MYKFYCRAYQVIMYLISRFLPWRLARLIEGENCLLELPNLVKEFRINNILIVTDKGIMRTSLLQPLLQKLRDEKLNYTLFTDTVPDPTVETVESAVHMYLTYQCDGILAIGGGSPIDCAKMVGARIAKPRKSLEEMKGLFKVMKKIPPLLVVPTTAGTGSEGTLAAVCSNPKTKEKFALMDISLIPDVVFLDPLLLVSLPKTLTAITGMDALTHAVEAYIGKSNTAQTRKWSFEATKLIFENLYQSYQDGYQIEARKNMQRAAYLAGLAFTRAYVGYVHAIAHTLGGFYHTPHGLANAVILPYVLDYYGHSVYGSLAELADAVGITETTDTKEQKAKKFIQSIKELNKKMGIPDTIETIQNDDIPIMVDRALKEANPLYPVPKILFRKDLARIYKQLKG